MIVGGLPAWKELPMPRHLEQIRAEPERPVTLFDRDVAVLIGLVATVEAEMRAGHASPAITSRLVGDLTRYELLRVPDGDADLATALSDMNERLWVARGEYGGVP